MFGMFGEGRGRFIGSHEIALTWGGPSGSDVRAAVGADDKVREVDPLGALVCRGVYTSSVLHRIMDEGRSHRERASLTFGVLSGLTNGLARFRDEGAMGFTSEAGHFFGFPAMWVNYSDIARSATTLIEVGVHDFVDRSDFGEAYRRLRISYSGRSDPRHFAMSPAVFAESWLHLYGNRQPHYPDLFADYLDALLGFYAHDPSAVSRAESAKLAPAHAYSKVAMFFL